MRVLAICCHPDDLELTCSGTLLKFKKQGHDVIACHASNGNMGHVEIKPDELGKIRAAEAKAAADLAGFELINADIDDLFMNSADQEQLKKLLRVIRYAKPDVILTHPENDYCSDHQQFSKLVFRASFSASVPHYYPELGAPVQVTPIYYVDGARGINTVPTEYVDITDEMDQKEEMLKKHESQLKWLSEHDGIDIVEQQRVHARLRGLQCGVSYAEAFTQLIVKGRMRPYRLLP